MRRHWQNSKPYSPAPFRSCRRLRSFDLVFQDQNQKIAAFGSSYTDISGSRNSAYAITITASPAPKDFTARHNIPDQPKTLWERACPRRRQDGHPINHQVIPIRASPRQLQIIQRPIRRQLPEHDQLRNPQQRPTPQHRHPTRDVLRNGPNRTNYSIDPF